MVKKLRSSAVLDGLYADGVIDWDKHKELTESNTIEADRSRNLLRYLSSGPPGTFDKFCDVLLKTEGQEFLAMRLRPPKQSHVTSQKAAESRKRVRSEDVSSVSKRTETEGDFLQRCTINSRIYEVNVVSNVVGVPIRTFGTKEGRVYVLVGEGLKLAEVKTFNTTEAVLQEKQSQVFGAFQSCVDVDMSSTEVLQHQKGCARLIMRMPFSAVLDILRGLSDPPKYEKLAGCLQQTLKPATCAQFIVGGLPPLFLFGDQDSFLQACRNLNVHQVENLLQSGVDVNKSYMFGETALHIAAESDEAELVDVLLDHGADAAVRDATGLTPLDRALGMDCPFSVSSLKETSSEHRKTITFLQRHYDNLVEGLNPSLITDDLYTGQLISKAELQKLQSLPLQAERAEWLVSQCMLSRGELWLNDFVKLLERTGRCFETLTLLWSAPTTTQSKVTPRSQTMASARSVALLGSIEHVSTFNLYTDKIRATLNMQFLVPRLHIYCDPEWEDIKELNACKTVSCWPKLIGEDANLVGLEIYGVPEKHVEQRGREGFGVINETIGRKRDDIKVELRQNRFVFARMLMKEIMDLLSIFGDPKSAATLQSELRNVLRVADAAVLWIGSLPPFLLVGGSATLFSACKRGHPDLVSGLLLFGIDPTLTRLKVNETPLHAVCTNTGSLPVARLLVEYGADVDALDGDGATPLHYAASQKSPIASLLVDVGCKLGVKDKVRA